MLTSTLDMLFAARAGGYAIGGFNVSILEGAHAVVATAVAEPALDFARLERLRWTVPIPLVLHGASGLPAPMVRRAIELGVCKLNVNTEVRDAYLAALVDGVSVDERLDLLD